MRGLTIVVVEGNVARLRSAFLMALALAALGGRARLFLDARAVSLLRMPIAAADDDEHRAAGQPALADLIEEALGANIAISLCQTGLQLGGATASDFDPRVDFGGIIAVLASLGDDRLVVL